MALLAQVKAVLTGAGVTGGGVSTFYTLVPDALGLADALDDFYAVVMASSPDDVTVTVQRSGFVIETSTGDVDGTWSVTGSPLSQTGASNLGFQIGVGTRIKWITSGIRNDRHITGSTFIVPLASSAFTTTGFLAAANAAALVAAGTALIADGHICILSRPSTAEPLGTYTPVDSCQVPLAVSWLRSRRT